MAGGWGGRRAGAGRPRRAFEEAALKAFRSVVTPEKWADATLSILEIALDGAKDTDRVAAYRLLAQYNMGLPVQRVETTAVPKGEALEAFQDDLDKVYAADSEEAGLPQGPDN